MSEHIPKPKDHFGHHCVCVVGKSSRNARKASITTCYVFWPFSTRLSVQDDLTFYIIHSLWDRFIQSIARQSIFNNHDESERREEPELAAWVAYQRQRFLRRPWLLSEEQVELLKAGCFQCRHGQQFLSSSFDPTLVDEGHNQPGHGINPDVVVSCL